MAADLRRRRQPTQSGSGSQPAREIELAMRRGALHVRMAGFVGSARTAREGG